MTEARNTIMDTKLQKVAARIKKDMADMKERWKFSPGIYVGKTDDFHESSERHKKEGYPVLLHVAKGEPKDIAELENAMITFYQNSPDWKCHNTNAGSGGNPNADKLYICFDSSVKGDDLYELDEVWFLGDGYPSDLNK